MAAPIEFYFDFSSPYGYLAAQLVETLAARHGRSVRWHPILLGVIFKSTGAAPLTEVPLKGEYSRRDFARSARFHGLPPFLMPPRFPIPSQAPARIVLWLRAQDEARATAAVLALYRAFFVEHRDISEPEVAADVVAALGEDRAAARAAVDDPAWKDALREEVQQAMAAGVFGSPFFLVDGEPFWGLDRLPQLERWLDTGGF